MTDTNIIPFISAIILTYNEEQNIKSCLNSLKELSADIFIVDSYSTDKTLEISREYTDKIYQHPFTNQAEQFNWALENLPIQSEWVFRLDADERLTNELVRELKNKLHSLPADITGLYIKRRVFFMGKWIKHGGYYPTWLLRIFRKGTAMCEQKNMDEHIVLLKGKTRKLLNDIIDDNHKGLSFWIEKHRAFAEREMMEIISTEYAIDNLMITPDLMGDMVQRKRWFKKNLYLRLPLFVRAFLYFIYRYLFRFGFLDWKEGLIFHILQGFWYRFLVDAKIYECKKSKSLSNLLINGNISRKDYVQTLCGLSSPVEEKRSLRIAIVNITSGGMSEGYKKILRNLIPKISKHPFISDVYVVLPVNVNFNGLEYADDHVKWVKFDWNWLPESIDKRNFLLLNRKIRNSIKEFSPDVIFIPSSRTLKFKGVPIVTMLQNMEPLKYTGKNPFSEKLVNWVRYHEGRDSILRSDRIIANSNFARNTLVNQLNVLPEKIKMIYLGTDAVDGTDYKKPSTIHDDWAGKFLFTAGSIRPSRGLEDLLNAMKYINNHSKIPGIVIAGEPSPRMESYHKKLKLWIQKHGLSDKICWAGHLSDKEMGWCYWNCYAFIMTSRIESFGLIALEAMAHGCINIAADNPCLPENFDNAALYYPPYNGKVLAEKIQTVMKWDTEKRKNKSEQAKKRAAQFSWDVCANEIVSELVKAVKQFKIEGNKFYFG